MIDSNYIKASSYDRIWEYFESIEGFKEHCDKLIKDNCYSCVVMIKTFIEEKILC